MIDWNGLITIILSLVMGNIIGYYFGYKRGYFHGLNKEPYDIIQGFFGGW